MAYRVALTDEVTVEAVRFHGDALRAWRLCLGEIETDPWERLGPDFEIVELDDAAPGESPTIVFTAAWFAPAILYFARQDTLDDGFVDNSGGSVLIWRLLWPSGSD